MRLLLRSIGSLWFAAVLLMLLLVAMACATIHESTHGTERALVSFYHAWWFKALLCLLGVNVLASVLVRYPFNRRQIGFILTHAGILITLVGAQVTYTLGIDGQVAIAEGQSVTALRVSLETLGVHNLQNNARWQADIDDVAGGFAPRNDAAAPVFEQDGITISVLRYVPDGTLERRIVDDNTTPQSAVEVSLSPIASAGRPTGRRQAQWIFAGAASQLGPMRAEFRVLKNTDELQRLLTEQPAVASEAEPRVRLVYHESDQEIPLEECLDKEVAVGDTGYSFRVLRYLPHATVGPENKLGNLSDRPKNPAIEAQISGPEGIHTLVAFAKFPEFQSMHLKKDVSWLKVTLLAPEAESGAPPVEILKGPDGRLHARFNHNNTITSAALEIGRPIESPWAGLKLAVLRSFDHARIDSQVEPVSPVREKRQPAVLIGLKTAEHEAKMWLQRDRPREVTIDDDRYELTYGDRSIPLGFELKLDRFRVGYYPGGRRPRSFESTVTVIDPARGGPQVRVISMNHPTKYGGYTLYQSSYKQAGGRMVSILSVSRDPGMPVVFAGYITTLLGMLMVIWLRLSDKNRTPELQLHTHHPNAQNGPSNRDSTELAEVRPDRVRRTVPIQVGGRCQSA